MIAKFDDDSYIDVDSVTYISGRYTSKDDTRWQTTIIVGGEHMIIFGKPGKNILSSFLWKHNHEIYDMIPDSKTYKKQLK